MKPPRCPLLCAAASLLLAAGCATPKHPAANAPSPVAITLTATSVPSQTPAAQAQLPAPEGAEPIYVPGTVRRIYLEGGVDQDGNAFGPQEMWVREPGHWNMNAVRHPAKAFIPTEMTAEMAAPAQVVTPNPNSEPKPAPVKTLRELYHISDIIVTGFVERGQEPLAREMAAKQGDKYVPYYDDSLGWILLPKSALQPEAAGS